VRFDPTVSPHAVTPYANIYGNHPKTFHFDADGEQRPSNRGHSGCYFDPGRSRTAGLVIASEDAINSNSELGELFGGGLRTFIMDQSPNGFGDDEQLQTDLAIQRPCTPALINDDDYDEDDYDADDSASDEEDALVSTPTFRMTMDVMRNPFT
jgi:hypothetical protein